MKKAFVIVAALFLVAGLFSCHKHGELPESAKIDAALLKDTTNIEFVDSPSYQFDTINQGDKVQHNFRIKNVGDKNLIIAHAIGSCGCTVPEYPKDPVKPGDIATIHVTFNSAGKHDAQSKTVTLVCNTPKHNEILYLNGFVKAEETKK